MKLAWDECKQTPSPVLGTQQTLSRCPSFLVGIWEDEADNLLCTVRHYANKHGVYFPHSHSSSAGIGHDCLHLCFRQGDSFRERKWLPRAQQLRRGTAGVYRLLAPVSLAHSWHSHLQPLSLPALSLQQPLPGPSWLYQPLYFNHLSVTELGSRPVPPADQMQLFCPCL